MSFVRRTSSTWTNALLDGGLSWSKVVLLASIVMPHTQAQWIELATKKNCAQIRRDVARARQGRNPAPAGEAGGGEGGLPEPKFRFQAAYGADDEKAIEEIRKEAMRDLGKLVTTMSSSRGCSRAGKRRSRPVPRETRLAR